MCVGGGGGGGVVCSRECVWGGGGGRGVMCVCVMGGGGRGEEARLRTIPHGVRAPLCHIATQSGKPDLIQAFSKR